MADFVAVTVGLRLVLVVDAIETTVQIILVVSPGDTRHDVNAVAPLSPGIDPFWQAGIDAIHHRHIRAQVSVRAPCLSGLKTSPFQVLLRIKRECRGKICRAGTKRAEGSQPGGGKTQASHIPAR